jgi:hypothetical protein
MLKTSKFFLLALLVGLVSLSAPAETRAAQASRMSVSVSASAPHSPVQETGGEITKANWRQHPKIKEVRAIVQTVKAGMSRPGWTTKKRTFEYCEPGGDIERVLSTDQSGQARFYLNEAGSEDSALTTEHYYDETGRIRFVFITAGAVNGSNLEHRIYFDETGKRIWEVQTYTKGPGYTWPEVWEEELLSITDAAGKFAANSSCPEVKPRAGGRRRRRSGR